MDDKFIINNIYITSNYNKNMTSEQKNNNKAMAGFGILMTSIAIFSVYAIIVYHGMV